MTPPPVSNKRPASAPPKLTKWALLDHYYEPTPGAKPELLTPAKMNPGFWTSSDGVKMDGVKVDAGLQKQVEEMLKTTPALKKTRFALVDLTGDRNKPRFAGNQPLEQTFTGSLSKITALYGAFQLQFDLTVLSQNNPSLKTAKDLFAFAAQEWGKTQIPDPKASVEKWPHDLTVQGKLIKKDGSYVNMAYADWNPKQKNPRVDASPNLEHIFDVDETKTPFKLTFTASRDRMRLAWLAPDNETEFLLDPKSSPGFAKKLKNSKITWDKLSAKNKQLLEDDSKNGVPFYERLLMMGDQSNNNATRTCLLDVGYLYIASALWQAGLFRPERSGGLWLSASYAPPGPGWIPVPVPQSDKDPTRQYQCASPATAAAFMTLLAQQRLISKDASLKMQWILDKKRDKDKYPDGSRWLARTFIGMDLGWRFQTDFDDAKDPYPLDDIYSKIGVGGVGQTSDCAFVSHKQHGKKLDYVLAYIDLHKEDAKLRYDLITGLDECIRKNNP